MVRSKSPYFRLYVDDFLSGTRKFRAEEIGVYMLLLLEQWDMGCIPDDMKTLKHIAKCNKVEVIKSVLAKFKSSNTGSLTNVRLEEERVKIERFFVKQKLNGGQGGRPKSVVDQPVSSDDGKPMGFTNETQTEPNEKPKHNPSNTNTNTNTNKESIGETNVSTTAPPVKVKRKREPKIFIAPSIQEIQDYLKEYTRTWSDDQAHGKAFAIHNYYQANGWKVGKNPMKDWKAAVRTWLQRDGIVPLKDGQMSLLGNGQNTQTNLPDARKLAEKYQ